MLTSSRSASDGVLFVERANELRCAARLSTSGVEPKGNRVLIGRQLYAVDPKPCDLSMGRVKRR